MKKLFSIIILGIMLTGLAAPNIALAQEKLKECCTLGNNITLGNVTCNDGEAAAPDAAAALAGGCGTLCTDADFTGTNWGMFCLINTIYTITDWLFYLLLIAVVLLGVIGGALYMTSAGDADKAGKGKSIITYAIIGLVLALIAKLVPSVVRLIVGM